MNAGDTDMTNQGTGTYTYVSGMAMGDIHICGTCNSRFGKLQNFIFHKRQVCQQQITSAPATVSSPQDVPPLPSNPNNEEHNNQSAVLNEGEQRNQTISYVASNQDDSTMAPKTSAEELVVIEVPTDGVPQIGENMDNNSIVVSLQSALLSGQQNQLSLMSQAGQDSNEPSVVTSPGSVVQQLLTSSNMRPEVTTHSLEEYSTAQSLLKVLRGGESTTLEVTATAPQEVQLFTAPQTTGGSTLDPTKSGLKKSLTTKKYQCDYQACTFSTAYQKDLQRHKRIHTGERPFSCHICGKTFNRADKLKIHVRCHVGKKPYSCEICNYSTSDSSSLKKHLRIHTDERPFKCQICQYASRNSSQLIVHLRTHTGDAPFKCTICSAKFKINSDLKRHTRLHTGEKPFKCDHCDYRCSIKGNLKTHYRINHSSECAVQCDKCEYKTSSRRALREHKKTHDTCDMVFTCPVCSYSCASRTTLKVHLRIHSTERPYKCKFCPFTSKQSGNIGTHIRRKHMETLDGGTLRRLKKKKGQIPVSMYQSMDSENGHGDGNGKKNMAKIQTMCKKPFKCDLCEESFVRQDSLRSHMRHHKEMDKAYKEIDATAQAILESTAQAVLSLGNPVNLDPNRMISVPRSSEIDQVPEASHSVEVPVSVEEVVVQSSPPISPVSVPPPLVPKPSTPPKKARTASYPTHRHILNQAASNRLAFVQNNQNQAIEDNFQNAAIYNRRVAEAAAAAAAAAAAPSPSTSAPSSNNNLASTASSSVGSSTPSVGSSTPRDKQPAKVARVTYVTVPKTTVQERTVTTNSNTHGLQQNTQQASVSLFSSSPQMVSPQQSQQHQVKTAVINSQLQLATASGHPHGHHQQQRQQPQQQQIFVSQHHQQHPQQQTQVQMNQVVEMAGQGQTTAMIPSSAVGTGVVPGNFQLLSSRSQTPHVINGPSMMSLQPQVPQSGTPINVQIVQNGTCAGSAVPQQVQVLLPASALSHHVTGNVHVTPSTGYPQQVILQVPANSEGVVENSGHVQIPIPLQLLQSQFMQQQTNKQQDMVPQNVQGQPQVLAIKSDPQNPVEQQSQGQKQQVATIQLLPQQVQYLQHAYSSVEPQSTPNPGFMQHQQHTPGDIHKKTPGK